MDHAIEFRPLEERDLTMLRDWLAEPYVARWWNHNASIEGVQRDFMPAIRGAEPGENLVAMLDGAPFGLVQRSAYADFPDYIEELAGIVEVTGSAVTIDYLIGDPTRVGRGIGTQLLRRVVADTWVGYPQAPAIVVPVVAANIASWRVLEKAGFRRIATGELEPDNPIDDRTHYVYRIDRPADT